MPLPHGYKRPLTVKPQREPAFPQPVSGGGMTLRDYFAAKVMIALIEHCNSPSESAETAYEFADAMILEREKR